MVGGRTVSFAQKTTYTLVKNPAESMSMAMWMTRSRHCPIACGFER